MLGHKAQHRTQVLEVYQEETLFVSHAKDDVEHALLHVGKAEQPSKKHGTHLAHGDADRDALAPQRVPHAHGASLERDALGGKSEAVLAALADEVAHLAGLGHTRDIALHVGHEDGHARLREALRHDLERDCLSRAGRAGDQAVPVRLAKKQVAGFFSLGHPNPVTVEHGSSSPVEAVPTHMSESPLMGGVTWAFDPS